jgi:hypothetical protein
MMTSLQPAVIGSAEFGEGAYFDHLRILINDWLGGLLQLSVGVISIIYQF